MTVFEVAKRLMDEDDPQRGDVSVKVEAAIQRIESLAQKVNRVQIACSDQSELLAYYLPAGGRDLCAPAVICISREDETGAALLGRLLPVAIGRSISILIVSHDDVKNRWRGQSEILLSCCLDYLSARPDVDTTRIGVYGEGLSAVLATDFAASDRRVAAAVCDGGLWNWVRTLASIGWMTKPAKALDDEVMPAYRSRLVRQLRCPILVLAGGRGTVSLSEAAKLQVDCTAAHIDLELATPRMGRPSLGEIENFVTIDDCIFEWLENKLARS
ncbi:alpha/beta hydrolase family protein [Bradyrhizobium sp. USDA 4503]